jgi:hypothetical protein
MRPISAILFFCLLVLLPGLAHGEPLLVAVGKESTWVNLDTGEGRIHGRQVRKVEIDSALVREKCDRVIDEFEGLIRLSYESKRSDWTVRVECMYRVAAPIVAQEPRRPAGAVERATLETSLDGPAENS